MKNEDNNPMEGHNYDGIRELDNPLPRWWLTIFYSTIVFAAVYYYHYEFGSGPSSDQELTQELDSLESKKQKATTDTAQPTPEDFKALLSDPETLKLGAAEFAAKCMACHGDKGQGSIGPNLTDNAWIHGDGSLSEISQIIKNGVAEKGMPAWNEMIKPKLILQISAYIRSLNGTNPPGAKAPEGQVYP